VPQPRTRATASQLLDRCLEVIELEPTTRQGYVGKINKHVRPTLGTMQVGQLDTETLERLYAQLRKCREHCHGRKYVQHRTARPHTCDALCARPGGRAVAGGSRGAHEASPAAVLRGLVKATNGGTRP
jgi:hypothetical protein